MPQGQSTAAAPSGQRRQRKSEGRPRLDATAAKLSEDRRIQIRRAQKTYRLKKDACIQSSQQRVCELEHKLTEIGQLLREHRDMLQATLHGTHPELLGGCERILDRLKIIPGGHQVDISNSVTRVESSKQLTNYCSSAVPQNDQASNFAASGYQDIPDLALSKYSAMRKSPNLSGDTEGMMLPAASNSRESCSNTERKNPMSETVDRSVGAQLNYTYSFLETSFARRLKRFSLEYAFQVFDDPHSDPHEVFRLFRLVPCFRERAKMYPYFKELVTSNRGHSLEISSLPFYTIGGAGTHYADIDDTGNPMYPSNMRVPRRILGILPMSKEGDPQNDISQTQQAQLELCGFGGDWFDCRDVEGYLKARGVQLDESTVCPSMRYVPSDSGPGGESRNVSFDLEYFTESERHRQFSHEGFLT